MYYTNSEVNKLNARHTVVLLKTIKIYKYRQNTKVYFILPLLDYMFRLFTVIIRPSSELIPECTRY